MRRFGSRARVRLKSAGRATALVCSLTLSLSRRVRPAEAGFSAACRPSSRAAYLPLLSVWAFGHQGDLICPLLTSAAWSEWIAPPSVLIPGPATDLPL